MKFTAIDIPTAKNRVAYNPETGLFHWLVSNRGHRRAGDLAGSANKRGYWFVKIDQVKYPAHRLAWALFYDVEPNGEIDHIDGDPSNNRILNLREATRQQNCQNLAASGVRYEADRGKWLARASRDGKAVNLGRFDTEAEALAARKTATHLFYGEFARK